jgi:hypothetical protein
VAAHPVTSRIRHEAIFDASDLAGNNMPVEWQHSDTDLSAPPEAGLTVGKARDREASPAQCLEGWDDRGRR